MQGRPSSRQANSKPLADLLVDEGLTLLRPIQSKHAYELFRLVEQDRQYLRLWLPWVDYVADVQDVRQLIRYYRQKYELTGALTACVVHRQQLAGVIGFNYVDWYQGAAALGYWLGASFRGQGLMVRACQRMVSQAFAAMGLRRLTILCAWNNLASQRVAEKLHFRREGLLRDGEWLNDHYTDLFAYGLLAWEWSALASML